MDAGAIVEVQHLDLGAHFVLQVVSEAEPLTSPRVDLHVGDRVVEAALEYLVQCLKATLQTGRDVEVGGVDGAHAAGGPVPDRERGVLGHDQDGGRTRLLLQP